MLANWNTWEKMLTDFAQSDHISKRRASIVLLNKVVAKHADTRLADVAFNNIERIKHEKDILITKAISWILRSLIAQHRERLVDYLNTHEATLPKIAIRETKRVLSTGRKTTPRKVNM